jgi:hypothetical protein
MHHALVRGVPERAASGIEGNNLTMEEEIKQAYAELEAASLERPKIARQKEINARKEIAARKRWLNAKDRVWTLESGLSLEISRKIWNTNPLASTASKTANVTAARM